MEAEKTHAGYRGINYVSNTRILGVPLVHIASGMNPETGRLQVARGIIAIGDVAFGIISIGGVSLGILSIGGVALAVISLAGLSIGLFAAFGGCAVSLYLAAGGAAVSGHLAFGGFAFSLNYAFGGFAIGKHPYGGNYQDPEAVRYFHSLLKSVFGDLKW